MDKYTKKYVSRNSKRNVSSDGVPNRNGGTWPNHPSQRYELPMPFSPGADSVNDAYRDGWDRIFGAKNDPIAKIVEEPAFKGVYQVDLGAYISTPCEVCGEPGAFHNVDPGKWLCEMELDS